MHFENVCIESLALAFPDEVWTSADIEEKLRPLYERLKLPTGRLELMTGIRERRMWPTGTRPSDASAAAGRAVLAKSALGADKIQLFIHAAVSRDDGHLRRQARLTYPRLTGQQEQRAVSRWQARERLHDVRQLSITSQQHARTLNQGPRTLADAAKEIATPAGGVDSPLPRRPPVAH